MASGAGKACAWPRTTYPWGVRRPPIRALGEWLLARDRLLVQMQGSLAESTHVECDRLRLVFPPPATELIRMDLTANLAKQIFEQLNRMLLAKAGQAGIINHSLEKGLGNEETLRSMLRDFLPRRYGVAKGKVANQKGQMSRQLDVIIYDALNFATLFIDENANQILPVESAYGVIEVKTTLTSTLLEESFANLYSVYELHRRSDLSCNTMVTSCPPYLQVFAFNDSRTLATIEKQFRTLTKQYAASLSSYSYTPESPAFARCTGETHMVSSIDILNKGSVYHMLDGTIRTADYAEYTLGMFMTGLVNHFSELQLPQAPLTAYLNWIMVEEWLGRRKTIRGSRVES